MRILNSLIVSKNLEGGTLWDFLPSILLQNVKKIEGGQFAANKTFSTKKDLQAGKGGESHSAEKKERGSLCFGMVFYFMLEALDAFKI